jgi:hypothetical protein
MYSGTVHPNSIFSPNLVTAFDGTGENKAKELPFNKKRDQ